MKKVALLMFIALTPPIVNFAKADDNSSKTIPNRKPASNVQVFEIPSKRFNAEMWVDDTLPKTVVCYVVNTLNGGGINCVTFDKVAQK